MRGSLWSWMWPLVCGLLCVLCGSSAQGLARPSLGLALALSGVPRALGRVKGQTGRDKCGQPCLNGGTCRDGVCVCPPHWQGPSCQHCRGRQLLTAPSGLISDGAGNYSKNLRCAWLIDGTEAGASKVRLRLGDFATECAWDHVYLYDGDGMYAPQLAALSGVSSAGTRAELVAESGKAFVYFSSDLAFNMSGFNISYRLDGCPDDCGPRGSCNGTHCLCQDGWEGPVCQNKVGSGCANASSCVNGECDPSSGLCRCSQSFHGAACDVPRREAVWERAAEASPLAGARASHAAVVVGEDMWVAGGLSFRGGPDPVPPLVKYSFAEEAWSAVDAVLVEEENPLEDLYDHSLVEHGGSLWVFGGVRGQRNVSNQLWELSVEERQWRLASGGDEGSPLRLPLHAAGHTATVVGNVMLVIFGYNPSWGYLNRVQEYHFLNGSWAWAEEAECWLKGSYGHSAVYDPRTELVYVFGGYHSGESTSGEVLDQLLTYEPVFRRWAKAAPSGVQLFRHSAALLGSLMIIVGGNAHNTTQPDTPTQCYSSTALAYDIACDKWFVLDLPASSDHPIPRYGHSLVEHAQSLYLFGGFNGRMLGDVERLAPGQCSGWRDEASCLRSGSQRPFQTAQKCGWDAAKELCFDERQSANADLLPSASASSGALKISCPSGGLDSALDCSSAKDCRSCVAGASSGGCEWCGGECKRGCGSEGLTEASQCPAASADSCCAQLRSCLSCGTNEACQWNVEKPQNPSCVPKGDAEDAEAVAEAPKEEVAEKKEERLGVDGSGEAGDGEANPGRAVCAPPCATHSHCAACSAANCMWCGNLARCVDINAYMAFFPYGQCTEWSSGSADQCGASPSNCSSAQTCQGCQALGPRCGWCDDGSATGLGRCLPGGASQPLPDALADPTLPSNATCAAEHWFFFSCPACQCNGHGHCDNSTLETALEAGSPKGAAAKYLGRRPAGTEELRCEHCADHTTGPHCDQCQEGWWGNALNGGRCGPCQCNGKATTCDARSGHCFCTTKGVSGSHCEKCDQRYLPSPPGAAHNDTCYYELSVDFIFTFKLDSADPKDKYVNQINFMTLPQKEGTDVKFKLTCSGSPARVNLSVSSAAFDVDVRTGRRVRQFLAAAPCNEIERKFNHHEFQFGTEANTTFYVYLYDFTTPVIIQISFAQTPPIDWLRFFITFACCFVSLLFVAAVLWKLKMSIDLYRRRQRMYVEMAQMASRPFSSIALELQPKTGLPPTPIALQPTEDHQATVLTVALRLPTGRRRYAPPGHTGLAVASALVPLPPPYQSLLQAADSAAPASGIGAKLPKFLRLPRPNPLPRPEPVNWPHLLERVRMGFFW